MDIIPYFEVIGNYIPDSFGWGIMALLCLASLNIGVEAGRKQMKEELHELYIFKKRYN